MPLLIDVLCEQLEYLVAHPRETPCLPLCSECCRLAMVKELLMSPFTNLGNPKV